MSNQTQLVRGVNWRIKTKNSRKMNTENNILIAEFMGGENQNRFIPSRNCIEFDKKAHHGITNLKSYYYEDSRYSRDWNWLMPVVEKIENDSMYKIRIEGSVVSINNTDILHSFGGDFFKTSNSKIEAVYNAVIEFIKWYNENK